MMQAQIQTPPNNPAPTEHVNYPARKRVGILVFDDFEPIDVWGFCEAFSIARFLGTGYGAAAAVPPEALPFELIFIANQLSTAAGAGQQPAAVRSYNGPRVAPDLFRDSALEQDFDVIMVPGGYGVNSIIADSTQLTDVIVWLKAMDAKLAARQGILSSVCTGAALLAQSGLLDGQAATTNHAAFSWVASQGPRVLWNNVSRWVDAGRYVTSAGVSAGTDMAFYLVQRLAGRAVAEQAALAAEYDWHRDPEQPIFYPQQAQIDVA